MIRHRELFLATEHLRIEKGLIGFFVWIFRGKTTSLPPRGERHAFAWLAHQ